MRPWSQVWKNRISPDVFLTRLSFAAFSLAQHLLWTSGIGKRYFSQVSYLEHLCLQVVCLRHRPEARKRPCAVSGTNARQSAEASLSTGEISIRILTLAFSSLGDRYSACDTGYRRPGDGGHVLYLEQSFWRTPEMPYRQVSPFLLSASVPAFVLDLVNVNDLVKCKVAI